MIKTICISAGHGAGDVGASNKNLRENELTVKISKRTSEIIRAHGVDCLYVPDDLTLVQTIAWINERGDQITIAVDVHINAGGGSGVEAWNFQGNGNESDKLSQFLSDACSVESGLYNRGIFDETKNRYGRLGFIHDTTPIAALVECGFIDGDFSLLSTPNGIEKMARGVARGCLGYIGVAWNPTLINPQNPIPPKEMVEKSLYIAALERIKKLEDQLNKLNLEVVELRKRPVSCPPQLPQKDKAQQAIKILESIQ